MKGRGEAVIQAMSDGGPKLITDGEGLVVLECDNKLATMICQEAHDRHGHPGFKRTLACSRFVAWIVRGRCLSTKVVKNCASCNIDKASRSAPIIKDVLRDRLEPSAPFTHVHIEIGRAHV